MIHEDFQALVESGRGCAVICAGSSSDAPHIEKLGEALSFYGVPYEVRICSAHKQVGALMELIDAFNQLEGRVAFLAVAGGTDALSGVLSYHALAPVVSCPPDGFNESCLRNPPGSSNATILKPKNAARFIAQMFARANPEIRQRLLVENQSKIASLEAADQSYRG